jgi:hypothetical protein
MEIIVEYSRDCELQLPSNKHERAVVSRVAAVLAHLCLIIEEPQVIFASCSFLLCRANNNFSFLL